MTNNIHDTRDNKNPEWVDNLSTSEVATGLELIARQQTRDPNWYLINEAATRLRGFATP